MSLHYNFILNIFNKFPTLIWWYIRRLQLCTEVITYNIFMFYVYDNDDVLDNCDFKVVFILHTMKCRTSASLWQAMRKPFSYHRTIWLDYFSTVMAIFYQSHHWIWSKFWQKLPVIVNFCQLQTSFAWQWPATDEVLHGLLWQRIMCTNRYHRTSLKSK